MHRESIARAAEPAPQLPQSRTEQFHLTVQHYPDEQGPQPLYIMPMTQEQIDQEVERAVRGSRMVAMGALAIAITSTVILLAVLLHG